MKSRSGSPFFSSLQELDLYDNPIFDRGASALAASPSPCLQFVELANDKLSEAVRAALQARFG
jgi:hypothetical protein